MVISMLCKFKKKIKELKTLNLIKLRLFFSHYDEDEIV